MYLTKKSFGKILIIVLAYFTLGSICTGLAIICAILGLDTKILYLGILLYALCPLVAWWGVYAEGTGKLLGLSRKLVRSELKPAEFIKAYEALKNADNLMIKKPTLDVLLQVAVAYDILDDQANALAVADEMLAVAPKKRKTYAKLAKCSLLFSYGMVEEAEQLFCEARMEKLDFMCQAMVQDILNADRAYAIGDYKTAEIYCQKKSEQKFPKLDNISTLVFKFKLGRIYEKLGEFQKAISYYEYCAKHGGETAMQAEAAQAQARLSQST